MKKYLSFSVKSPLLKVVDFRFILATRILVTLSLQIQSVLISWHLYSIKKDPLLLGLVGLTEAVPAILGAFYAGHVVDNNRPFQVFRSGILALLLNSLFLAVVIQPDFDFSENWILFFLFFAIFISGLARSFLSPSVMTLIPQIVPRPLLASASAFNSSTYQMAAIIGPAIGGFLYGAIGPQTAFIFPIVFAAAAFISSNLISKGIQTYRSNNKREPVLESIRSGLHFALTHKILFSAMALDMFSVLFGGAVAVLPIFADQIFKVGPDGLGLLRAAPAVGSVLVSGTLALWPLRKITGRQLLFVVGGFGFFTLCFALTANFYWALLFLALTGAFDGVSMVIRGTILQLYTPDHMRGRVSAVNSVFITSSNEIGAFESGFAARIMGLVPSVVFGGIMTLLVVAMVWWKVPELKSAEIQNEV